MKRLFKIAISLFTLTALLTCSAFADIKSLSNAELNKYNLKAISKSSVPKGVTPVVINTEEELKTFLSKANSVKVTTGVQQNFKTAATGTTSTKDIYAVGQVAAGAFNIRLDSKLTLWNSGSFGEIKKVERIYTSAYGIPGSSLFISYSPDSSTYWSSIASGGQTCRIEGGGTVNFYIIFKGSFVTTTKTVLMKINYDIKKGITSAGATVR